jgi:hypothetical protein
MLSALLDSVRLSKKSLLKGEDPVRGGLHPSTPFMAVRGCPNLLLGQPQNFPKTHVILKFKITGKFLSGRKW